MMPSGINNSLNRDLEHQLLQKAQAMGMERARAAQSNIAENLQNAVPDSVVEQTSDGSVILRARRLFSRLINDERLRDPSIFTSERFIE